MGRMQERGRTKKAKWGVRARRSERHIAGGLRLRGERASPRHTHATGDNRRQWCAPWESPDVAIKNGPS